MIKVLSHGFCYDGISAAWVAWKVFGDKAQYTPCVYGNPLPQIEKGDEVYILDFSFPRQVLLDWEKICKKIVLLDHHRTAEADLKGLPFVTFNMEKSGALLAYEYFYPNKPTPWLIQHVSDRDLWKFKLDKSRAFHSYLKSHRFDFKIWDEINNEMESGQEARDLIYAKGEAIEKYQNQIVQNTVDGFSWVGYLDRHRVAICNATCDWSEIGEYLLKKFPDVEFSVSYWDTADGKRQYSLRSNSDFDVSEFAKTKGGGGHAKAAGFILPIDKAPVIRARLSTKGDMV